MRPTHLSLLFGVLALVCPPGGSKALAQGTPPAAAAAGHVLSIGTTAIPEVLDWTFASYTVDGALIKNIMEGLFEVDRQGKAQPRLAESYAVSADGLKYTFRLRGGVKWSDGKPLTAADFIESWKRLLSPLSYSYYADFLSGIAGARGFHAGSVPDFGGVAVKALGEQTLEVMLEKPCAYFTQLLSVWVTFPVRADLIARFGTAWTDPANLVTLGPFRLDSIVKGKRIVLKRNPKYYGAPPRLDEVHIVGVEGDSEGLKLFKDGKLDVYAPTNFAEARQQVGADRVKVRRLPRSAFLQFDLSHFPFTSKSARQAFAMAIDRSKVPGAMHGAAEAATTLVPPGFSIDSQAPNVPYDPAAARKLLAEAGVSPATLPKIDLLAVTRDDTAFLTGFVQDQIRQNLGLNVTITLTPRSRFEEQRKLRSSAIVFRFWSADYIDPQTYLGDFQVTAAWYRLGWANARFDELVNRAAGMTGGPERVALYRESLKILEADDTVIVPLYYNLALDLVQPRVKGFEHTPLDDVFYRDVNVD